MSDKKILTGKDNPVSVEYWKDSPLFVFWLAIMFIIIGTMGYLAWTRWV